MEVIEALCEIRVFHDCPGNFNGIVLFGAIRLWLTSAVRIDPVQAKNVVQGQSKLLFDKSSP